MYGYYFGFTPIASVSSATVDTANILQKLDFSLDSTSQLLLDVSGLNNHAKLVGSNCYLGNNTVNFSAISSDPVGDNLKFYDFSVEFWFAVGTTSGYQVLLGRTTGALTKNLLSAFVCDGGKLKYYSGDNNTNVTVDVIASVSINTIYYVKCSVINSTGNINWIVNEVNGSTTFTNKTPISNQTNDLIRINGVMNAGSPYYYLSNGGKLFGIKYYQAVDYTTLGNYWPMAEGLGTTTYDVVGTKHLTLTSSWTTQDDYHYNFIKGFQLYGNSDANNSLIRVPYKNDGTTITPTIIGYTKFADCPAGLYNNFCETGIKRNYNSVSTLTSVGISNTNIIYYGQLSGSSGISFCKNYMELETEYTVFSTVVNRKKFYKYKLFANYIDDTVTRVLIVGTSGKIHNTNIKYCVNRSIVGGEYYDVFVRNGTYNLTNPTTELSIVIPQKCGIIGESITTTIINGYLAPNTSKATIEATSTFHTNGTSFKIGNLAGTCQNMRYVCHDDGDTINPVKRTYKVYLKHLGNDEARVIDPTIIDTCDAYGSGFQDGLDLYSEDSIFEGYGPNGRGYASHSRATTYTTKALLRFKKPTFKSIGGTYSFRWSTGATTKEDEIQFDGANFNSQQLYYDPTGSAYEANADKFHVSAKLGDSIPTISSPQSTILLGLQITVANNRTLEINSGTVATLLFATPKIINAYTLTGRKQISEIVTGNVPLKTLLGNCTSVNKVLSLKIDGVDTDITFNANYSSMTNAQVLTSINTLNVNVIFSEYSFCSNASFTIV